MPDLNQLTKGIPDTFSAEALRKALQNVFIRFNTQALESGALATGTGSAAKIKTANNVQTIIRGKPVVVSAAEVTLAGTVTDAHYNVIAVESDAAGTLSATLGTDATSAASVVLPAFTADKARLGYCYIHASGADITLGTTVLTSGQCILDYVNTPGVHDFTLKSDSNLIGD